MRIQKNKVFLVIYFIFGLIVFFPLLSHADNPAAIKDAQAINAEPAPAKPEEPITIGTQDLIDPKGIQLPIYLGDALPLWPGPPPGDHVKRSNTQKGGRE